MKLRIVQKKKHSALIELDAGTRGTLPLRELPLQYPVGFAGEIGDVEWASLQQALEKRALNLLLDYLAKAEHSSHQCRNLLRRQGFETPIIERALHRCRELKFLDDARFAEQLISSYLSRHASKKAIGAKLREQRIPASIWEPLMQDLYDPAQAVGDLLELMRKYCVRQRDLPRAKLKEKTFTHFYRKGFDLADIQAAWERLK